MGVTALQNRVQKSSVKSTASRSPRSVMAGTGYDQHHVMKITTTIANRQADKTNANQQIADAQSYRLGMEPPSTNQHFGQNMSNSVIHKSGNC